MSEQNTPIHTETQQERWFKYGGNVALVVILVFAIAALVIWAFGTNVLSTRLDTTAASLYSLKPQTVNIIKNNKQPIKIVSLYTPSTRQDDGEEDPEDKNPATPEQVQAVADLLDEYRRKGNNIEVEVIDPKLQHAKVVDLTAEVRKRSGPEVKKYEAVVAEYPGVYLKIEKISAEELEKVGEVLKKIQKIDDPDLVDTIYLTVGTVQGVPPVLRKTKEAVDKQTQQKIPDFRRAVNFIDSGMAAVSALAGKIVDDFTAGRDNPKVPQEMRTYMRESMPKYQELKKLADDFSKKIKELGDIKLSDLKQSLNDKNSILVMGENEWRILPFDRVWQRPVGTNPMASEGKPKKKFAGEQQITSAILAITNKKRPKVVFVRPGGPPLATAFSPFQRAAYSMVAERLRDYNFEVMDKDLSGMWAMQAQMQRQFAPPEPSDEEIRDAVWVVVGLPAGQNQFGMPPPSMAAKLDAHLKAGGSAVVFTVPNGDGMAQALDEWGVKIVTDAIVMHEQPKSGARGADEMQDAMRIPYVFVLREYGDHMLTRPLNSLESVMVPILPIETQPKAGYTATRILPVPQTLKIWGETSLDRSSGEPPKYDPPKGAAKGGDLAPPFFGGAIVEKNGGGRLIVFGSIQFPMDGMIGFWDPTLERQGRLVSRFPGNAELFLNSIFWLARQEPLISISPTAMEVSRIKEIPSGVLGVWRVGVVLILLPALVLIAGVVMFIRRRD